MTKRKKSRKLSNRNARIVSRVNTVNTIVTKTTNRDYGSAVVEVSSERGGNGASRLFIRERSGEYIVLDGNEARTVYRTLQRHFLSTFRAL